MNDFTTELNEYVLKIKQRKHYEAKLADLLHTKNQLEMKLPHLRERMVYEQSDVDKLEDHSFYALLSFVTGNRKERLNKEKEEALAAIMKYDTAISEMNAVESEIQKVKQELNYIDRCQQKYDELLKSKENYMAEESDISEEILALRSEIAKIDATLIEFDEAIDAGEKLLSSAKLVLESLEKAKRLERLDVRSLPGFFYQEQYDEVDFAQNRLAKMQTQLALFKSELADVGFDTEIKIKVDKLLKLHVLIDNYIYSPTFVYLHLSEAKSAVLDIITQLNDVLKDITAAREDINNERNNIQNKINKLIIDNAK